jgi:hypothetical protein
LTNGSEKMEGDTLDNKRANARRLTMTLSESFVKSALSKTDVEHKENKSAKHQPRQLLSTVRTGSLPVSAVTAKFRASAKSAAKLENGVVSTRNGVPNKRLVLVKFLYCTYLDIY